jgi:hypothetical protein
MGGGRSIPPLPCSGANPVGTALATRDSDNFAWPASSVEKRSSCIPTDQPERYSGWAYTIAARRVEATDRRREREMGGHAVEERREAMIFGAWIMRAGSSVARGE